MAQSSNFINIGTGFDYQPFSNQLTKSKPPQVLRRRVPIQQIEEERRQMQAEQRQREGREARRRSHLQNIPPRQERKQERQQQQVQKIQPISIADFLREHNASQFLVLFAAKNGIHLAERKTVFVPTNDAIDNILDMLQTDLLQFLDYPNIGRIVRNHITRSTRPPKFKALSGWTFPISSNLSPDNIPVIEGPINFNNTEFIFIDGMLLDESQRIELMQWLISQGVPLKVPHDEVIEEDVVLEDAGKAEKEEHEEEEEPAPDTPLDNFTVQVELEAFHLDYRDALSKEKRQFGEESPFMPRFIDLNLDLSILRRNANIYNDQAIMTNEFNRHMNTLRDNLKQLQNDISAAGRRCLNEEDIFSFEDIDDIPDEDFIHLNSGYCWDIGSLQDYIRSVNGENISKNLRDYPTPYIWSNQEELLRILNHPASENSGFRQWFENRGLDAAANSISEETLRMLSRTTQLLFSNGPEFVRVLEDELTEDEMRMWNNRRRSMWGVQFEGPKEVQDSLLVKIQTVIKSRAIGELDDYLKRVSDDERNALLEFDPDLLNDLELCRRGQKCVLKQGRDILQLHNQIARMKDLPTLEV